MDISEKKELQAFALKIRMAMVEAIHSFGPFASRRCFDQIFLSGGYAKNDITVIGTGSG